MLPAISNRDLGDENDCIPQVKAHGPCLDQHCEKCSADAFEALSISDCEEDEAWREHTAHRIADMERERRAFDPACIEIPNHDQRRSTELHDERGN